MVIFICFLIASVSAILAYWIAGPIWIREHGIRVKAGAIDIRLSGAIGEIVLIGAAALLLYLVDFVSDKSSIADLFSEYGTLLWAGVAVVSAIVILYGIYTAVTAPAGEKRPLFFTYLVYNAYSIIFFVGGFLLALIIIQQTSRNGQAFEARGADILAYFASNPSSPRALELSFIDLQILLGQVELYMVPAFIFMAGIFVINIVIRYTPIYGVFRESARNITHATTAVGVLTVLGVAGWVYVDQYARLIDDFLAQMYVMREGALPEDPDFLERYGTIYLTLDDQKSILGYIGRLANEWGGLAAILGVMQWVGRQMISKKSKA
ncbi:hypothetical protein [Ponticaulis sp.]|uniref:hypothetical protein n=1 Tax=Ponticaulis sp. TaxID=2020902 RepID=UPI00261A65BB|nr:hypothetical protein [Ponticaulis sp.]